MYIVYVLPVNHQIACNSTGDCAIGDGVKKYFFSLCLRKIQTGLHLDLGKSHLNTFTQTHTHRPDCSSSITPAQCQSMV